MFETKYMEKVVVHPTLEGTPQEAIILPTITLMALSGLEKTLKETYKKNKVNVIIYADDFVITGASKELLEK